MKPVLSIELPPDGERQHWVELHLYYYLVKIFKAIPLDTGDLPVVTEGQDIEDVILCHLAQRQGHSAT